MFQTKPVVHNDMRGDASSRSPPVLQSDRHKHCITQNMHSSNLQIVTSKGQRLMYPFYFIRLSSQRVISSSSRHRYSMCTKSSRSGNASSSTIVSTSQLYVQQKLSIFTLRSDPHERAGQLQHQTIISEGGERNTLHQTRGKR